MKIKLRILLLLFSISTLSGQGKEYQGPDDPAGDPSAERSGYMTGNRVLIFFLMLLL